MAERRSTGWQDDPAAAAGGATAWRCLVVVARLLGMPLAVERLFPDGLPAIEPEPEALAAIAEQAGFRVRALRLDGRHLTDLRRALPAIVRLRDGRCVVLTRIEGEGETQEVVLCDPARDEPSPQTWRRTAFDFAWSGDILLLKRAAGHDRADTPFGWRIVADMVRGPGSLARDLALTTGVLAVLALLPILFAQALLGDVSVAEASDTFVFLGCGLVIALVFEAAFTAVRQGLITRLTVRVGARLETLLFDRLLRLPVAVFETTPVGVLAHRLDRASAIPALLAGPLASVSMDGVVLVVFLAAMMTVSVGLTAVVVALGLLALGLTLALNLRLRRTGAALEAAEQDASALLTETLAGFAAIKSLALSRRQARRWDVVNARATQLRFADGDAAGLVDTVGVLMERLLVFGPTMLALAFAVAGLRPISVTALFGLLLLGTRMAAVLRDVVPLARCWNAGRDAMTVLASLADTAPEADRGRPGVRVPLKGHIAFHAVQFTYPDAPAPALQAVSFTVAPGTSLGIVGRSGAGKSTLVRLLQRFHADYQGLIKVDGMDVREIDLDHLRAGIGVVTQDTPLFPGTLRDNLMAVRPRASDEEVAHVLRMVGGEALIERLPRGLDTVLDERAAPLSDGQRQMVAIARAILADPAILVLDDATAALDPPSEAVLIGNLRRLAQGRTLIVVSQRLAALAQTDTILVLDRGEVQDIGAHADLLERSDLYSGLWRRQTARLAAPEPSVPRLRDDRVA